MTQLKSRKPGAPLEAACQPICVYWSIAYRHAPDVEKRQSLPLENLQKGVWEEYTKS